MEQAGIGGSRGGRRPVLFQLSRTHFFALSVDIGVSETVALAVDLSGSVCARLTAPTPKGVAAEGTPSLSVPREAAGQGPGGLGPRQAVQLAVDLLGRLRAQLPPQAVTLGVVVTVPGPVDYETGTVLFSPNLPGWEGVPLRPWLRDALGLPCWIENDANAAAWAERWLGVGRETDNLLFVLVDAGVGSGLVADGELYRGARGTAGELGHITVDMEGPRCNCGNYGCLEAVAAPIGLVPQAVREIRKGHPSRMAEIVQGRLEAIDPDVLLAAAVQRDPLAVSLLQKAGRYIGIGVAAMINLFNPELIVIGGRFPTAFPDLFPAIAATAQARAFQALAGGAKIVPSSLGPDAVALGGAALVLRRFFQQAPGSTGGAGLDGSAALADKATPFH